MKTTSKKILGALLLIAACVLMVLAIIDLAWKSGAVQLLIVLAYFVTGVPGVVLILGAHGELPASFGQGRERI